MKKQRLRDEVICMYISIFRLIGTDFWLGFIEDFAWYYLVINYSLVLLIQRLNNGWRNIHEDRYFIVDAHQELRSALAFQISPTESTQSVYYCIHLVAKIV